VIIVDGNPVIRGVARLACEASSEIEIVSEAGDGASALELCRELRPDVLVLDLPLSDMDGFEVVRQLKQIGDGPRIVVTGGEDADSIYRARVLGVEAYVEKASLAQKIAATIELVAEGQNVYTGDHDRRALERLALVVKRARLRHRILATLTPREQEILPLLARGLSNQQCARRLGISIRTLESHIGRIYRKLEARSRMEAVGKAVALGLLGEPDGPTGPSTSLEYRT
jgi:DNA-binding NarL/FixJ family response regulator